jgi:hypothetical protein
MLINNFDDLRELLQICHKNAVTQVTVGEVTLHLVPNDPDAPVADKREAEVLVDENTGLTMTPEEIRYYAQQMKAES